MPIDTDVADQALDDRQWWEPVELPRIEKRMLYRHLRMLTSPRDPRETWTNE